MRTLLINGSPNKAKGNTEIFIRQFIQGMSGEPEVRYVVGTDAAELAHEIEGFDQVLIFFPMYVNAMPGIVKRLFEHMEPDQSLGLGFFVQYGFEEAAQSDYLMLLLRNFITRMGYRNLGIVTAGGMAGVRWMPDGANRKTFERLQRAGALFEQTGQLSDETIEAFSRVRSYTPAQLRRLGLFKKLGITSFFWNRMIKQNGVFDRRLDRPFGV